MSELDIQLESGMSARYTMTLSGNNTSFTATAKDNLDDDTVLHIWKNGQNKSLQNTINDTRSK